MVTVESGIAQANRKPPTQFQPLHIHGMSLSAVTSMERRPMPLALELDLRKCSGSLLTTETAKSFLLCPLILFLLFLLWKKKKKRKTLKGSPFVAFIGKLSTCAFHRVEYTEGVLNYMTLSGSPSSHALKLHTLIASPLIRHRGHSAGRFVLLSGELWKPRAHPACPSVARVPVSPTRARHVLTALSR